MDGDRNGGRLVGGLGSTPPEQPRKKTDIKEFMEDSNQHLWSVSYADLLMVILAFFVVFDIKPTASGDGKKDDRQSALSMIVSRLSFADAATDGVPMGGDISPHGGAKTTATEDGGVASRGGGDPAGAILAMLVGTLPTTLRVEVLGDASSVNIHFPDEVYASGHFTVENADLAQSLKAVCAAVQPYMDEVRVTFVGHSDSQPLSESLRRRVGSNMLLSSMRAVKAAEFAIALGLKPDRVVTQGDDAYARGQRSLSIKIEESPRGDR